MKIGLIDYYLDEYHANHYPEWIKQASGGAIEVAYAYAEINSPIGGKTTKQWCLDMGMEQTDSIEKIVEKSDALIVLSPDNPERHEELCFLPLQSGKRTYIDKTFAETKEIALRIFENAHKHNTPCYSASALRFAAEYNDIDKSKVEGITSLGPGPLDRYTIHQLEPIIMLMGADIVRIKHIGTKKCPAYVAEWQDGRRASVSHHGWECPFTMVVDFKDETSKPITIESDFYSAFIADLVDFFETGDIKVPNNDTVAVIAAIEAAVKASRLSNDEWVKI